MDAWQFISFLLHLEQNLGHLVAQYGSQMYFILFLIVFCETGLVVFPFLPGDSLIFIAGTLAVQGAMDPWLLGTVLSIAAIVGNTVNYWIGRKIGQNIYSHNYRWISPTGLQKTHTFYERHGGKTIILARFVPIVRTFAPFVAGVSEMEWKKFQFFNIAGALLWVTSLLVLGYQFGDLPFIREHLDTIAILGIGAAIIPLLLGGLWRLLKKIIGK